jgi:tRNA A37 threonylcarbamoyltransferase TsaD
MAEGCGSDIASGRPWTFVHGEYFWEGQSTVTKNSVSGLQMRNVGGSRARTKRVNETPSHTERYFAQTQAIAQAIDTAQIESLATGLPRVRRRGGRLFLLVVGGTAANCAHVVNHVRKLCDIEAYSPTDNVAELTDRINDDGRSNGR